MSHLCVLTIFLTDMYVKDIQTGICAKDGEPVVEKESAATALVDGRNLLGPVVGNFCMNLAIKKAKDVGIGWVVAHSESQLNPKGNVIVATQSNRFPDHLLLKCLHFATSKNQNLVHYVRHNWSYTKQAVYICHLLPCLKTCSFYIDIY